MDALRSALDVLVQVSADGSKVGMLTHSKQREENPAKLKAVKDDDEDGFSDEGEEDGGNYPTDAEIALALAAPSTRAVHERHDDLARPGAGDADVAAALPAPSSVLNLPMQVADNKTGSVIVVLPDSEQCDHLHYDADGTGWQGRSIPNSSIGGSELGMPSSSTRPRRTSTTKGGAVIGCGASPPPTHELICACRRAAAAPAAAAAAAATDDDEVSFADEGDTDNEAGVSDEGGDDDEESPTDAQLALATRAVYARRRHDLKLTQWTLMQKTETELGGVDLSTRRRVIETTIALIKHEEVEVDAAHGRHDDFDDGARDDFAMGVATGLGVPRDGVRVTGARAGLVIVETDVTVDNGTEAAAAFSPSLTDPPQPLADEFRFRSCAVSGVRVEEPAAAAADTKASPAAEAPAESAPPPAPAMTDCSPRRVIGVVLHGDIDNRHLVGDRKGRDARVEEPAAALAEATPAEAPAEPAPPPAPSMTDCSPRRGVVDSMLHGDDDNRYSEEEIEGRDGGLWDDDSELDDDEEEAVQQESCVAPWDSGGASAAAAAPAGLWDDDSELDDEVEEAVRLESCVVPWDSGGASEGELDDDEEEAVRQESCVAPWDSGGASTAAAAPAVGLQLHGRMSGGTFHADRSVATGVLTRREESPSQAAPDDASATGLTYDDITKSPPPHLRCVVSLLSSPPPVRFFPLRHPSSGAPPRHYRVFVVADVPGFEAGSGSAPRAAVTLCCLVLAV